jgi:hypothetical protein
VGGEDTDDPAIGIFITACDYVDAATARKGIIRNKDGNHDVCGKQERVRRQKGRGLFGSYVCLGFQVFWCHGKHTVAQILLERIF